MRNAIYLDPRKRADKQSLSGISNLALEICKPLESALSKVFPNCSSKEDVCDKIRNEWKIYQMEVIQDSYFMQTVEEATKTRHQPSYWEKAFQLADIPIIGEKKSGFDVDKLKNSLEKSILDDDNSPKFPNILALFKAVASISHGNSATENGFSINKYILQLHGNSLAPDTIEALRFVKDTILAYGNFLDIPITKSLLESAKLAYSRYNADLELKRKQQREEEAAITARQVENAENLLLESEKETVLASIQQVSVFLNHIETLKLTACYFCFVFLFIQGSLSFPSL